MRFLLLLLLFCMVNEAVLLHRIAGNHEEINQILLSEQIFQANYNRYINLLKFLCKSTTIIMERIFTTYKQMNWRVFIKDLLRSE